MDVLYTADFETPVGSIRVASSENGLAYVQLPHANGRGFDGWRLRHVPEARVEPGFEPNRPYVAQILAFLEGKRCEFDIPVDLHGTPFQLAVLEKVAKIPFGETKTYGEIAEEIGHPAASRAVGAANGANPVSLVIPCHRVIARTVTCRATAAASSSRRGCSPWRGATRRSRAGFSNGTNGIRRLAQSEPSSAGVRTEKPAKSVWSKRSGASFWSRYCIR